MVMRWATLILVPCIGADRHHAVALEPGLPAAVHTKDPWQVLHGLRVLLPESSKQAFGHDQCSATRRRVVDGENDEELRQQRGQAQC